jgi:acetyl-CoA carboxylase carboxyl transferase subunit alpha
MWRDAAQKELAAAALRITAPEVAKLGCVDEIVGEPGDGAHTDPEASANMLAEALKRHLAQLKAMPVDELVAARQKKFRNMAQFYTEG